MARSYLNRARRILAEAEGHHEANAWNLVVRRSQEAVELALKGVLRWVGLEVPRVHDVGLFLKEHRDRFQGELGDQIESLASISRRLRQEREISFYGDEETGLPPEELYTNEDAAQALTDARQVVRLCENFISR